MRLKIQIMDQPLLLDGVFIPSPSSGWQKICFLSGPLKAHSVMRVQGSQLSLSGKSLNAARSLFSLGSAMKVLSFCPQKQKKEFLENLFGSNFSLPRSLLPEYKLAGSKKKLPLFDLDLVGVNHFRTCTTLLEPSALSSELVEPHPCHGEKALCSFERKMQKELKKNYAVLLLTGSLPPDFKPDTYARWLEKASAETFSVADVNGLYLEALLKSPRAPSVLKPNLDEWTEALKKNLKSPQALVPVFLELQKRGCQLILASRGEKDLWGVDKEGAFSLKVPKIQLKNAIGAGDAMSAGLCHGYLKGLKGRALAEFALWVASKSCENLLAGELNAKQVLELVSKFKPL